MYTIKQHPIKCYCANSCCYLTNHKQTINKTQKNYLNNRNTKKTNFIKVQSKIARSDKPKHGLGHSYTNNVNFSRRNSDATTFSLETLPSDTTNNSTWQSNELWYGVNNQQPIMATPSIATLQFTKARLEYEISKSNLDKLKVKSTAARTDNLPKVTEAQKTLNDLNLYASKCKSACHKRVENDLVALQEFRIQNASECFNDYRQYEAVHTQCAAAEQSLAMPSDSNKCDENKIKQRAHVLTPYALRQRMLQLRLAEDSQWDTKSGKKAYCAPVNKSFALRYQ